MAKGTTNSDRSMFLLRFAPPATPAKFEFTRIVLRTFVALPSWVLSVICLFDASHLFSLGSREFAIKKPLPPRIEWDGAHLMWPNELDRSRPPGTKDVPDLNQPSKTLNPDWPAKHSVARHRSCRENDFHETSPPQDYRDCDEASRESKPECSQWQIAPRRVIQ